MAKRKQTVDIDEILAESKPPIKTELSKAMNDWGLEYSYATLQDRALISNYDFVKPVQLRSIWGMYKQGLRPNKENVKEAQVQATIMGKYHPHGDCVSGDTRFRTCGDKNLTIKEMYDLVKAKKQKRFVTFSIDKLGRLQFSFMSDIRIGQYTTKIYHIHFSNGMECKVTNNHPFMLFSGRFIKAENLVVGDIVTSGKFNGEKIMATVECKTRHRKNVYYETSTKIWLMSPESIQEEHITEDEAVRVTRIEIEHVDKTPMYDFTVNDYANALCVDDDGNFLCLHNSSIKGVLDGWAQKFNSRVPLVKTTGQAGVFTGQTAISARYLEVGMNDKMWELVRDTQNHGCTWTYNEQGDDVIPYYLPTRFPLGIINGSAGIATGFACTIPPHNPDEIMNSCIAYLRGDIKKKSDVLKYVKGPDFPTGAEVLGTDEIKNYIKTGTGPFLIRGLYNIKELSHGKKEIDFTELPYNVSVEKVMSVINDKKQKGLFAEISEVKNLSDVRLQTDKCECKLAIYVKSGANIDKLIKSLYKNTPCQVAFSVNSTLLVDNKPKQNVSLLEMIQGFCQMRKDSFLLRSKYRCDVIKRDLHTIDGMLKVLVDIDKTISIIRQAENQNEAKDELIKEFSVDNKQAEQILSISLRQLTKSDTIELQKKQKDLTEEFNSLDKTMNDENLLTQELISEMEETKEKISSPRRTKIVNVTMEAAKEEEN